METKNSSYPLVSIVVLTYNSSATVIETLDSTKNQTYKNIELIITDDSSKDETISICNKWIDANGDRFVRAIVITSEKNTGTSANCNRGYGASSGEWIKVIAGDDILCPSCISDYVRFINDNPFADIVFSKMHAIGTSDIERVWYGANSKDFFDSLSAEEFKISLLYEDFLPAPTMFLKKTCYIDLGGFDESIPVIEDWPFYMKAVVNNKRFLFLDSFTVIYRYSEKSVCQGENVVFYSKFQESSSKAKEQSIHYLKDLGFWSNLYFSHYSRCIVLKVLNPFGYYYRHILKKYNTLKRNIDKSNIILTNLNN